MTKFLTLQLLRSGVEWNPGLPKNKRSKFSKCNNLVPVATGQCRICDSDHSAPSQIFMNQPTLNTFQSALTSTDFSTDANDQLAQSMPLYRAVDNPLTLNNATTEYLVNAGYHFENFNPPTQLIVSDSDLNFLHYQIVSVKMWQAMGRP